MADDRSGLDDQEKELIRQGERTVDNLKRLFAFMFALSFTVAGTAAIDKLKPLLTRQGSADASLGVWILNAEMLAVFVITAGVFYHQGAKFLDNRYARHPRSEAHPIGLAWDYLTLVVTMVPFFFMAHSLHPSVTHAVGYTWYFAFYVLLIGVGLVLLVLAEIRHSEFVRGLWGESIDRTELAREGTLRTYWLLMNSFILACILGLFFLYDAGGFACPTAGAGDKFPTFLYLFGIVAVTRDVLDYRYAWRFIYPINLEKAPSDLWPISRIARAKKPVLWTIPAYLLIVLCLWFGFHLRLWDFDMWAAKCAM